MLLSTDGAPARRGSWSLVLTAAGSVVFPAGVAAQGLPVQNGPMLPVAIWWIGSCVLGLALAYGILRNRTRTPAEKRLTENATKELYAEEDRDLKSH